MRVITSCFFAFPLCVYRWQAIPGLVTHSLLISAIFPIKEFYQARKKLGDESRNLPAGVIGPMINDEFSDVTFALLALKAKGEPQRLLVREAESLRQRLLHLPGVKKVNIIGEQSERIYVRFHMIGWRRSVSPHRRFLLR